MIGHGRDTKARERMTSEDEVWQPWGSRGNGYTSEDEPWQGAVGGVKGWEVMGSRSNGVQAIIGQVKFREGGKGGEEFQGYWKGIGKAEVNKKCIFKKYNYGW